jgi:tRNA threonylcarbamoyladenosine biosynthesis protein TsaB
MRRIVSTIIAKMSRALAIETSGRAGSVALVRDGDVVAGGHFAQGLQHAARMLPMIDDLMKKVGWSPRDIEEVYVSVGPGSFTGLRIGVTLAKTMALATGVKLVAVPSLRVLVDNAPREAQHVIVVLDAKRDQIFTARFERTSDGGWIERVSPRLSSLAEMLAESPRPVYLLGDGIPYHQKFIPNDPQVMVTSQESWIAQAKVVAKLGRKLALCNEFADPLKLTPIYIRRPEAEEKYLAQNPNAQAPMTN